MNLSILLSAMIVAAACIVSGNEDENLYSFTARNIYNEDVSLDAFRGKVVLIVNVASKCGYTDKTYKELQQIYDDLGEDDHFTILGFPCNQFGNQEPEKETVIEKFVKDKYDVEFPMFNKVDVIGENAHPLWKYLVKASGVIPDWNFYKYLVDHTGKVVVVFPTKMPLWIQDPQGAYDHIRDYVKKAKKYSKEVKAKVVKKELRNEL